MELPDQCTCDFSSANALDAIASQADIVPSTTILAMLEATKDAPRASRTSPTTFVAPCIDPYAILEPMEPPSTANVDLQPSKAPLGPFLPSTTSVLEIPPRPPEQRFQNLLIPPVSMG